jgi:hypothetical protein
MEVTTRDVREAWGAVGHQVLSERLASETREVEMLRLSNWRSVLVAALPPGAQNSSAEPAVSHTSVAKRVDKQGAPSRMPVPMQVAKEQTIVAGIDSWDWERVEEPLKVEPEHTEPEHAERLLRHNTTAMRQGA